MLLNCEKRWRRIDICRVGGVAHNVVGGKTLCNVFLTFKISVIQVLLQLQKGSRNFIKILGISLADSNETFPFKFCNRDHQRRRTSAIKTSTLATLNMDLNLQNREEKCFCCGHTYTSLNNSYQNLSSIYGNVNNTPFCLTLKHDLTFCRLRTVFKRFSYITKCHVLINIIFIRRNGV